MPLTDAAIRGAKATEKPRKITDERGLFLLVNPNGSKLWRFKYRIGGKEKLISLGQFPDVPLRRARDRRDEARKLVADGVDPSQVRREGKRAESGADTFATIAGDWLKRQQPTWAETHAVTVRTRLDRDVLPYLGKKQITEISAPDVLAVLRRIEARGAVETAHRIRTICNQVFAFAIASGLAIRNPVAELGREALKPVVVKPMAAITGTKEVAALLNAIDDYKGTHVVRCAFRLLPLVFVRSGELRGAEWREFDLDAAQWVIPAVRMKLKKAAKLDSRRSHIVPLSTQAIAILRDLHELTGTRQYVFSGARSDGKPMSENAITAALRTMGYPGGVMSGHGFRTVASTWLNELGFNPDAIEAQLAHTPENKVRAAYNRSAYLAERKTMMQAWADHLDAIKAGNDSAATKAEAS